ncbi:LytR C-terminal domain-containing protein [Trueperella bialowiezensis]|uniref:LytR/CpsA/Psr regulator C-terminal domain-containing protein n=1 Tax=Trueperella bialowiezensis TaxID=312285 RepID=A0A448PDW5_9ACTO|nr:LytR C-terminal domain-containing protein [Trueperella bialowiezensis]VEI13123.1 Uncharacterised protein [Trueperella bialowiezensis]
MTSNARAEYRKRTQQRQTVIFGSIIAVMAILLVLGVVVWTGLLPFPFNREFSQPPNSDAVVCPAEGAAPQEPASITVTVYNATSQTGLAASVAGSLAATGVVVNDTANWSGTDQSDPVRLYTSADGVSAAYTLRAYFPSATVHIDPNVTSQVVEVVLGAGYSDMVAAPTPEQFAAAMEPIPDCASLDNFAG